MGMLRPPAAIRSRGLTLALILLFVITLVGQILTGRQQANAEALDHHQTAQTVLSYLGSGHFWEATGENWESEFLQMAVFVVLTAYLWQRGSPASNDPAQPPSEVPASFRSPWPVRRGGWWKALYARSLALAFGSLFMISVLIHLAGGVAVYNDDQVAHGHQAVGVWEYLWSSRFWFESFQNWQSEFLSLAAMVYLSVYLRYDGSAESKPLAAPHDESGR